MNRLQIRSTLSLFKFHFALVLLVSFGLRIVLYVLTPLVDFKSHLIAFALGILFDLSVAVYTFAPLFLFLIIAPSAIKKSKAIVTAIVFSDIFFFVFISLSEYIFFDEFKDRFNFIAVDYLVYTNEVLRNIWESYHVVPIVLGVMLVSAGLTKWILPKTREAFLTASTLKSKAVLIVTYGLAVFVLLFFVNEQKLLQKANSFEDLIGKNGIHSLFAAYLNNEIDYEKFYPDMDQTLSEHLVHEFLKGKHESVEVPKNEDEKSIVRNITSVAAPKHMNVIVVVMESLSARFMGIYGNTQKLTPNLDRLAKEGLFFNNLFSTGTRTVRGLEAVTLSIPPTPGQSIVRRPGGTGLFNIGTVFKDAGYRTEFIYGGRGFFDNMGAFFEGNGFEVKDQNTFPKSEIVFSNAWGVSDEDLFGQVLKSADESHSADKKFFQVVMTTSNHRPYTYPENRIDIASGSGRDGAIKYSDYAVGKLIADAFKKPWFNDTVFVFVSDHNAAVAGGTKIYPEDYRIPLIIYSPQLVTPRTVDKLASQIDLAPTLLGLLNFSYQSRFFGLDLLKESPNRAFLGTYQKLAYLVGDSMVVLSPQQQVENFKVSGSDVSLVISNRIARVTEKDPIEVQSAVAQYKTASLWYKSRLLEEKQKFPKQINIRR